MARLSTNFWTVHKFIGLSTTVHDCPKHSFYNNFHSKLFFKNCWINDLLSGKPYQKWRDCPRIFGLPKTVHEFFYIHNDNISTRHVFCRFLVFRAFGRQSIVKEVGLSTNFWTVHDCPRLPKTVHEFFTFILLICPLNAFIDTFYFFVHLSGKAYQKWRDCPRIFGLSTNFLDYPKLSMNFFTFIMAIYPLDTFFVEF